MAAQPRHPHKMPPLTALRAFEAAGRLGGFAPAATELGVTPAAITAHLKTLESALGVTLFERRHKGVQLTELGARVLPEFTAAFRALDGAVHQLRVQAAPDVVRIATTSDLAALWLSPRLSVLRARGIHAVPVPVSGPEAVPGVGADLSLFMEDEGEGIVVAIASPDWIEARRGAGPLPETACMRVDAPWCDWAPWLAQFGAPLVPRGPVFSQAVLAVEEAANGAGMVVLPFEFAARAIEAGRVAVLADIRAPSTWQLTCRRLHKQKRGSAAGKVQKALGEI